MDSKDRVKIWNTFLKFARDSAASLKQYECPSWQDPGYNWNKPGSGGTLGEEDMLKLSLLSWCILSAQARASHLIQECKEEKYIDDKQAESFSHLNFKQQWLILPVIKMKPHCKSKIDFKKYPHMVIKELHDIRDNLFHVNHNQLKKQLDKIDSDTVINHFINFVDAMEDMNVLLERGGRKEPSQAVLEITRAFRPK